MYLMSEGIVVVAVAVVGDVNKNELSSLLA